MSRLQLALNVEDLDRAVGFYSTLLGAAPAKRRPGYANFAVADPPLKLVLIEQAGQGGTLNHLGVEVESVERLDAERARLADRGLVVDTGGETTCCYARQDKFWVEGAPHGEQWEVYTVLADSPTFFGEAPQDPAESFEEPAEPFEEPAEPSQGAAEPGVGCCEGARADSTGAAPARACC